MGTYMEYAHAYKPAMYMWQRFLRIQERMYGQPRPPLINTYKKIAQMFTAIGDPAVSMSYFEKAENLGQTLKESGEVYDAEDTKSEEQKKKEANEKNA